MADLYVGLVHYPIYNKRMNVIAGAVTNFDIHDISRTCRTYNVLLSEDRRVLAAVLL